MAKPTVRVRVAFDDGPYVASPTWTDVTGYVRSVRTSRGRNDDWQNFDTGTAFVVLDNRDRRFDPTYTAGTYYGKLQPRRQIQIQATTDSGSTYKDIFRGYVDGWPVTLSQAGFDNTVSINCYDAMGLVAQNQLPPDWSHEYILSLAPTHYWRLNDQINPANIPSTVGTLTNFQLTDYGSDPIPMVPAQVSTPTSNTASFAAGIPSEAIAWPDSLNYSAYHTATSEVYGNGGSYCAWFTMSGQTSGKIAHQETFIKSGTKYTIVAYIGSTGIEVTQYANTLIGSTTSYKWTSTYALNPAIPHHYAMKWVNVGAAFTPTVYIDGVLMQLTASTGTASASWETGFRFYGPFQQVVNWKDTALSNTQLENLYKYSANAFEESTVSRFTRILDQTSFPSALRSAPASSTNNVIKLTLGGAEINNELQLNADSEGGELYVSKTGVLTMTDRNWFLGTTAATSQATFGASGIPIGTEMTYSWTAQGIRNSLDISWSGDSIKNVKDATSIANYGVRQTGYDTILNSESAAQTLGQLLVSFGRLPRLVMSAIELNQALSLTQWATVLDLELLQRITVNVPEKVGSNLSQQQIIQQIEHTITPGTWETTILGSSRWSSVFVLDSSTLDGVDLLG